MGQVGEGSNITPTAMMRKGVSCGSLGTWARQLSIWENRARHVSGQGRHQVQSTLCCVAPVTLRGPEPSKLLGLWGYNWPGRLWGEKGEDVE